jgi:hypothetical protein
MRVFLALRTPVVAFGLPLALVATLLQPVQAAEAAPTEIPLSERGLATEAAVGGAFGLIPGGAGGGARAALGAGAAVTWARVMPRAGSVLKIQYSLPTASNLRYVKLDRPDVSAMGIQQWHWVLGTVKTNGGQRAAGHYSLFGRFIR